VLAPVSFRVTALATRTIASYHGELDRLDRLAQADSRYRDDPNWKKAHSAAERQIITLSKPRPVSLSPTVPFVSPLPKSPETANDTYRIAVPVAANDPANRAAEEMEAHKKIIAFLKTKTGAVTVLAVCAVLLLALSGRN
jgi:hypothetical protein